MITFEITVRAFFTSEEVAVVPSASFVVAADKLVTVDLVKIAKSVTELVTHDMPLTNIRPMTRDEVEEYRKNENDD